MSSKAMPMALTEFVADQNWLADYPVRYAGSRFNARMSVIRLGDDRLMLHSPGPLDVATGEQINQLGEVACIVAPSSFHHLHLAAAQRVRRGRNAYLSRYRAQAAGTRLRLATRPARAGAMVGRD